jgi:choline monooxygenase
MVVATRAREGAVHVTTYQDVETSTLNDDLTRRALQVVLDKTTDMADELLRVPLNYYNDPKLTEIEETQILRRTPLAVVPSAQLPKANDYVVRSVLGRSLLITRDKMGRSHIFLNYCRHRGAMPACGSGNASRFTCPYHAWTYKNTGELFTVPASLASPRWTSANTASWNCRTRSATASSGWC